MRIGGERGSLLCARSELASGEPGGSCRAFAQWRTRPATPRFVANRPKRMSCFEHCQQRGAAPTLTESIMWQVLSGSRLGVGFRRQVPIGRHIADFLAPSRKLVVEVDGGVHGTPAGARAHARRDRYFARLGYRVVRLPAAMVQHRLHEAVALVVAALTQPRS